MKPFEQISKAIKTFKAVTRCSCGYPVEPGPGEEPVDVGWVKFALKQDQSGWLTLEFLAWVVNDMQRAGERLRFFPTSPPPHLNEPGECLAFVLECYPKEGDAKQRFARVAEFINQCREEYWEE